MSVRRTRGRCRLLAAAVIGVALPSALAAQAAAPSNAPPPARAITSLARLNDDLQALTARVQPAVVQILVTGYAPTQGSAILARQRGGGSGAVVDPQGYIVTNAHVVDGARRIEVVVAPPAGPPGGGQSVLKAAGKILGARIVGVDRETDLAVLKVDQPGLTALPFGDSEVLRSGQLVVAFGSPRGLEGSVSVGVVSAVARQVEPESPMIYVQTDASINPGNSGGPLVDAEGRLVGLNTLILSQSGGSEGIGFAAPSNIVRSVFEQIKTTGRVRRSEIGARAQTITPDLAAGLGLARDWGVVLSDVAPGGPAAEAGLSIGDVVVSLDGKVMENARQFDVNLYRRAVGTSVTMEVQRGSSSTSALVAVRERADDPQRLADLVTPERNVVSALGILALDLDARVAAMLGRLRAQAGVVVASAAGDALPWQDALKAGDVIYSVNANPVMDVPGLRSALDAAKGNRAAVLQVERQGVLRYVVVPLD